MRWCALILLLGLVSPCFAEESWTNEPEKESAAPSNRDRIIRWCSPDGKTQRFASTNIEIKDYQPCGELQVPITCDPSGKRYIGASGSEPYAYKDCSRGPRIVLEKTAEEYEAADASGGELQPEPLDSKERFDLASDLKQVEQKQNGDGEIQLQRMLDSMLGQMLGQMPKGVKSKRASGRKGSFDKGQIDELIRYVDPQHQDQLKQLLEGY